MHDSLVSLVFPLTLYGRSTGILSILSLYYEKGALPLTMMVVLGQLLSQLPVSLLT